MTLDNRVTRALALAACIGFLAFGLIRIGVGSALLAQLLGLIEVGELAGAIADTRDFLARGADRAFIPFGVGGYLAYIVAMGVVLGAGAVGALRRRAWGTRLIALYLAMHAALFVNYLTINPKIWILLAGIALLALVATVRKPAVS